MFSDAEFAERFVKALGEIASQDVVEFSVKIEHGFTGLPRSSSIFSCARQQLHSITEQEVTEEPAGSAAWAPMMGYAGEQIVRMVLRQMGYTVTQPEIPEHLTSGHVDGIIEGLDLDEPMVHDNKVRSAYRLFMLQQGSFDAQMFGQMQDYMRKTGLKKTMITLVPHDLSEYAKTLRWKKVEVDEPLVLRQIIEADQDAFDLIERRAEGLSAAKELGLMVNREYNPGAGKFPCTWCPTMSRCVGDDFNTEIMEIPGLPEEWRE